MNQGSDAVDLRGFKPIDLRVLLKNLLTKYFIKFAKIADIKNNLKFLDNLRQLF